MYLDPKVDEELAARAEVEGVTKADLMRRFLVEGLGRPASLFAAYATPAPLEGGQLDARATPAPSTDLRDRPAPKAKKKQKAKGRSRTALLAR